MRGMKFLILMLVLLVPCVAFGETALLDLPPIQTMLLDFSAPWCGPCRKSVEAIAQWEAHGVVVQRINADRDKALVERYRVEKLPTLVIVENGREIDRLVGWPHPTARATAFAFKAGFKATKAAGKTVGKAAVDIVVPPIRIQYHQCPCADGQCGSQQPTWQPAQIQQPTYAPPLQSCPYPALVMTQFLGGGDDAQGSGFIADRSAAAKSAIVVTCAHGYKTMMTARVITQDNRRFGAEIVAVDAVQDLCVLRIADPGLPAMCIADQPPREGESLYLCGFAGGNRIYMGSGGQFRNWCSPSKGGDKTFVYTSCDSKPGCSGGPILNAGGEVVAIVTGNSGGAVGPCLAKTLQTLRISNPPFPRVGLNLVPVVFTASQMPWRKSVEQFEKQDAAAHQQEARQLGEINSAVQAIRNAPQATPCCPASIPQAPDPRIDTIIQGQQQTNDSLGKLTQVLTDKEKAAGEQTGLLAQLAKQRDEIKTDGLKEAVKEDPVLRHTLIVIGIVLASLAVCVFGVLHLIRTGKGFGAEALDKLAAAHPTNTGLQTAAAKADAFDASILAKLGAIGVPGAVNGAATDAQQIAQEVKDHLTALLTPAPGQTAATPPVSVNLAPSK